MGFLDKLLSLTGIYTKPPIGQGNPPVGPGHFGPSQRRSSFEPIPTEGPKLAQYPTSEDAAAARAGGFGYGEPTSAYIEGTAGRIFGDKRGPLPAEGPAKVVRTGITQEPDYEELKQRSLRTPTTQRVTPEQQQFLQDAHTRAALAVNYSPVAAVGYNPQDVTADVSGRSALGEQIVGLTDFETGKMHFQQRSPRTVVHESLHRGLVDLAQKPGMPAHLYDRIMTDSPEHESMVRQLMYLQAGNPETNETAVEQRTAGTELSAADVGILNKLAQEAIRKRRPYGGPR